MTAPTITRPRRRDEAAELATYVKKVVAEAPRLSEAQRRRLASILTEDGDR